MNGCASKDLTPRLFDWTDSFLHELFGSEPLPWEVLEQLERRLLSLDCDNTALECLKTRYPQAWFDPDGRYWIHPSARIEPGAFFSGLVVLSAGACAGHCCRIRGPVYLGPNSHVGHASEVKHSLLLERAAAAHLNFVGDSILGEGVNLGAGAVCANLRFDHRPIVVKAGDLRIQTTRHKCGAFVGAGAQIGCGATLSPGTVVGRSAWIAPNLNVRGWVPEGARLLSTEGVGRGIS